MRGIVYEELKQELEAACRPTFVPAKLAFEQWDVDFLTSYITNVHHEYLRGTLPATEEIVWRFADEHVKKYPYMQEVKNLCSKLKNEIIPHLAEEEQTIFPYICQVFHAYENKDSYARLLVKTLRKPLETMMRQENELVAPFILKIRELCNNYTPPEPACTSHRIALSRLKELDNDLAQHIYLENDILFPKAIRIEQELLR
jgi:regulator of cell morphogenesis and NO signaling